MTAMTGIALQGANRPELLRNDGKDSVLSSVSQRTQKDNIYQLGFSVRTEPQLDEYILDWLI